MPATPPMEMCETCVICMNPRVYCPLLPTMIVFISDNGMTTTYEFEVMEDAIAKTLKELKHQGRIESKVTGNTTTFGGNNER